MSRPWACDAVILAIASQAGSLERIRQENEDLHAEVSELRGALENEQRAHKRCRDDLAEARLRTR